jgi:hypothetical protein
MGKCACARNARRVVLRVQHDGCRSSVKLAAPCLVDRACDGPSSSTLAGDSVAPLELLAEEVENEDDYVKLNAYKRVRLIAEALGPEATEASLLPFLLGALGPTQSPYDHDHIITRAHPRAPHPPQTKSTSRWTTSRCWCWRGSWAASSPWCGRPRPSSPSWPRWLAPTRPWCGTPPWPP